MPIEIKYGGSYYVKNLYGSGAYLDVCGGSNCDPTSVYSVGTSSKADRVGVGTGTWKILSAASAAVPDGQPVKIGDMIYLANQYKTETYLDTCGGSTCDPTSINLVSTSTKKDRANLKTATWLVVAAGSRNVGDPLRDVDPIHLQDQYKKGYLDACGGCSCDETMVNTVATSSQKNRAGLSTATWTLRPSVSVDWLVKLDDVNFDKDAQTSAIAKASGNPQLLFTQSINNDSAAAVDQVIQKTVTKTASFEFSMAQTLAATASVKGTVGVPGVASVEASISLSLTLSFGEKWTDTTTETFMFGHTIKVPANTRLKAIGMLDWVEDAVIPVTFVVWVGAKDLKSRAPLSNDELKRELGYAGFDGSILDDTKPEALLVALKGEFRGSYGVDTTLSLSPA